MLNLFWPIARGAGYTLIVTGACFGIGLILGAPVALARRSPVAVVRWVSRSAVELVRGIPPITWLFLIFFGLPLQHITFSPVIAAIVGLSLIATAYISEIYRAGFLAIPRGQWEAAHAVGLGKVDMYVTIIAPQMLRAVSPPLASYALLLLKETAVISTIGVADVTFNASQALQNHDNEGLQIYVIAAVVYIVLSVPLALVSRNVDRTLRAKFSLG